MRHKKITPYSICALLFSGLLLLPLSAGAQDLTSLGGDLTQSPLFRGRHALQVNAPNVTGQNKLDQLDGFTTFHQKFSRDTGLGPTFNHTSCGGCHIQNGRGKVRVPRRNKRKMHHMLVKVALPGMNEDGSPVNVPDVGEQLQEKKLGRAKRRFRVRLRFTRVKGMYPDGTPYKLLKPKLRYRVPGFRRNETLNSLRMTPLLIGLGLLESIPEADILDLADPEDSNFDGISGKPQYVPDLANGGTALGRFGFRASHPTVAQQSGAAAFNDMGVTNPLFNDGDEADEIEAEVFRKLAVYQQLAGVPPARNQDDPDVIAGKALFQTVNCSDCHVMTFVTENAEFPELDGQTIHPFTDLLLHDMGEGLADTRDEFSASGREWRTTPLWGLGYQQVMRDISSQGGISKLDGSRVKPRFLHDGRARTIEEAILWHGGEAEASKEAFKNLSAAQRAQLLKFLESL